MPSLPSTINPLRTTEETAAQLRIHPVTLRKARCDNSLDLPHIRINGAIRYSQTDIDAFVARHREGSAMGAPAEMSSVIDATPGNDRFLVSLEKNKND